MEPVPSWRNYTIEPNKSQAVWANYPRAATELLEMVKIFQLLGFLLVLCGFCARLRQAARIGERPVAEIYRAIICILIWGEALQAVITGAYREAGDYTRVAACAISYYIDNLPGWIAQ